MSGRTTLFANAMPGGRIEYAGDLTPPIRSYASSFQSTSIGQALSVPGSTIRTGSAVVSRRSRRGGILSFWRWGATMMRNPIPQATSGFGNVQRSPYQRDLVQLQDWQINPSWHETGYPRNLGLSMRTPQLSTKTTGGPGNSQMASRPLFTRVQNVPRATARVYVYPTRGAGVR